MGWALERTFVNFKEINSTPLLKSELQFKSVLSLGGMLELSGDLLIKTPSTQLKSEPPGVGPSHHCI